MCFFSKNKKFVIVIECDERAHSTPDMRGTDKIVESDFIPGYQEKCEWTRPFVACDLNSKTVAIRTSKKEKMGTLWQTIRPGSMFSC